jgi:hypothetical protein
LTKVSLGIKRKFKTWAATMLPTLLFRPLWTANMLPIRLLSPLMRGGDCNVLSSDPLIIYVKDWVMRDQPFALLPVLQQYKNQTVHILVSLSWNHDDQLHIQQMIQWQTQYLRRYPLHRIIYLSNSTAEHGALASSGLKTVLVSSNAFVSPEIFKPLPESEKRFDAVYDARINPFKRHTLATEIKSLALITARAPSYHNESYIRSVMDILPQAYFFNNPLSADYKWMSLSDINTAINQCHVGLCLSAVEGPMYASMQYLLAGLPVVSTQSRGGRNEFFSPEYVRIVADNPEAVATGVREMCHCPLTAEEIRFRTLDKIEQYKKRFFELIDSICSDDGWRAEMRLRWDSWTYHPVSIVRPSVIAKRIESAVIRTTISHK